MTIETTDIIRLPGLPVKRAIALLFQDENVLQQFHLAAKQILPPHSGVFCGNDQYTLMCDIATEEQTYQLRPNLDTIRFFIGSPQNCPADFSPVSLYRNEEQIAAAEKDMLWLYDAPGGLTALCLYAWICATAEQDETAKTGVIQSWFMSTTYKKGLSGAMSKLCACIGTENSGAQFSFEKVSADTVERALEACARAFVENTKPEWNGLKSYPVDDNELNCLTAEVPRNFRLLPLRLRKSKQYLDWKLIGRLFGYSAQGTSVAEDFADEYVRTVHANDQIFEGVWSKSNAFYYRIPLTWLTENLSLLLRDKLEKCADEYRKKKQELSNGKLLHIYDADLVEVMKALEPFEARYNELIRMRLRMEFYRRAYVDATKGRLAGLLSLRLQQARDEVTKLQNQLNTEEKLRTSELSVVDWANEPKHIVQQEFEQAHQFPEEWTAKALEAAIAQQCSLRYLDHRASRPELIALIRCAPSDQSSFASINFRSSGKAKWRFEPALPKGFVAVLSVVPNAVFKEVRT